MHIIIVCLQSWSKLEVEGAQRPMERSRHAALCLGFGGDQPQLLVIGGTKEGGELLSDAWLLDIRSQTWQEKKLPVSLF